MEKRRHRGSAHANRENRQRKTPNPLLPWSEMCGLTKGWERHQVVGATCPPHWPVHTGPRDKGTWELLQPGQEMRSPSLNFAIIVKEEVITCVSCLKTIKCG